MTSKSTLLASLLLVVGLSFTGCMAADDGLEDDPVVEQNGTLCQAQALEVIVQGRENRFGLNGQQVALDPGIPMDRICNRVAAGCKQICADAEATARATGVRGFQDVDPVRLRQMGRLADTFNAALGIATRFRDLGADRVDASNVAQCNAKVLQVVVRGREHRFGFDGRQVALNPAIPIDNICQPMAGSCKAVCLDAKNVAVASGVRGFSGNDDAVQLQKMGVLADTFNASLGHSTGFARSPIVLP
jgi:hypothetical protein